MAFRIQKVAFYSLLSFKYDTMAEECTEPNPSNNTPLAHPCAPLIKLLTMGSFYFSIETNLTRSMQFKHLESNNVDNSIDSNDSRFVWNYGLLMDLIKMRNSDLQNEEKIRVNSSGIFKKFI
jgi:hypothetical protein